MATDYGGAYGGQPWRDARPPYPGPPGYGRPPSGLEPPPDPAFLARQRRKRYLAITALTVGVLGFLGSVAGIANQVLPRNFTAGQRQQITNWEFGKRWRALPASAIFPVSVRYPGPTALDDVPSLLLTAQRLGIARQATCAAATDPTAAGVLDRDGCTAVLRATYADGTDTYVVTVGTAVLPGASQATAAARTLAGAGRGAGLAPTVRPVPFKGTPAALFTGKRRQLSGVVAAGTYVVLYTVGYADSRPGNVVASDNYADGEMTSAGLGVAHTVLSRLAAPVPPPHCPGTPGC